jgi:RNA polymerase sigma-70 factor, ECF subfamily
MLRLWANSPKGSHLTSPPEQQGEAPAAGRTPALPGNDCARLREELVRAVSRTCPPWLAGHSDDLVQAALLRVVEIARRTEGNGEFTSFYLRKAAYSATVDEIRRLRRRREVPLDEHDPEVERPAAGPDPERCARGREAGRAIRDCLARLVTPRRLAVALHLQGHGVPEVARLLGWGEKRTDNLVYRGLADLRACLADKGIKGRG